MKSKNLFLQAFRLFIFFKNLIGTTKILKIMASGLIISFIEIFGLALIFPFIKIATDKNFYNSTVSWLPNIPIVPTLLTEHKTVVVIFGICLISIYCFRGWITAKLVNFQAKTAAHINSKTSKNLIKTALSSRYQLFLDHSPTKIAGISYSNTTHIALLFQSITSGFNEAILLALILFGVIAASPIAFLFLIFLVLILVLFFFKPLSKKASIIGHNTQETDLARHRFVFAMASAIRDIKIMGLEKPFSQRNQELAHKHAYLSSEYTFISTAQRVAVEVVLVCGIVTATLSFVLMEGDITESTPLIATIGMVAIRTAPAISRLAGAYNSIRYSIPFADGLLDIKKNLTKYPQQRKKEENVDFPGEYRAHNICFSYNGDQVLKDCSLSIPQGKVIAIVGPSGSGKSTLLDLLSGLQPPSSGSFSLGGTTFSPFLSAKFPEQIGYVPQNITLLDDTIAYNVALENSPNVERLQQAIEKSSLLPLVDSLPQGLQTLLGDGGQGLSGGQRQRLGIARALYRKPALLILDEVTSALDETTAQAVINELLSMRGEVSLLFVTHHIGLIAADYIYKLEEGKLSIYNTDS